MYRSRMAYEIVFMLLLFFYVWNPSSAGKSGGLCISPGGRFHPFSTEGKSPRKVPKGPRDFALCRVFRQSTCCDVAQTYHAFELVRTLATSGEASRGCLHIWELLECSICDPRIGVQPGPPLICASFCDMILQDCSSAYFSIDPRNQVLSPCGLGDIICGKASEWASNGTELCRLAGFAVKQDVASDHVSNEPYCYGGQASLKSISGSWKASRSGLSARDKSDAVLKKFQQRFQKMPVHEKVRWAIGGMVLTSGLLYARDDVERYFVLLETIAALIKPAHFWTKKVVTQLLQLQILFLLRQIILSSMVSPHAIHAWRLQEKQKECLNK